MFPQYVAPQSSSCSPFVAPESQAESTVPVSYLFNRFPVSFPQGYTQVTYPQNARGNRRTVGADRVENRDRRLTCLRASRAFAPCPCLPSWQHVAPTTQVKLKNSWSLTRFRSQSSQSSLASTTKEFPGQAATPVPSHLVPSRRVN